MAGYTQRFSTFPVIYLIIQNFPNDSIYRSIRYINNSWFFVIKFSKKKKKHFSKSETILFILTNSLKFVFNLKKKLLKSKIENLWNWDWYLGYLEFGAGPEFCCFQFSFSLWFFFFFCFRNKQIKLNQIKFRVQIFFIPPLFFRLVLGNNLHTFLMFVAESFRILVILFSFRPSIQISLKQTNNSFFSLI